MSVEGMWCFVSGDIETPNQITSGGIIVFETGKIFGGDGAIAHVGTYAVRGKDVTADVESWCYNPAFRGELDVFGDASTGDARYTRFEGAIEQDGLLYGTMSRDNGQKSLRVLLKKLRELP